MLCKRIELRPEIRRWLKWFLKAKRSFGIVLLVRWIEDNQEESKMKRLLSFLLMLVLVVSLLAVEAGAASKFKNDTIIAGIGFNNKTAQYKALEVFKKTVEDKTGGKVKVNLFHSSQLGDDREMMEALRAGTQQMTCPASANIAGFVKEMKVLDFPYFFTSRDMMEKILDGEPGKKLFEKLKKAGLHGLAYWDEGFRNMTNNVRKITCPDDLKGLKMRTMENPIHMAAFKKWGANPISSILFGDLFSAMEQGVVDGQENPASVVYVSNFYETQKYYTHTEHFAAPYVLIISEKYWQKASPELKKVLNYATRVATKYHRTISREMNNMYLKKLKSVMNVTILTQEQKLAFRKKTESLIDEYKDSIGKDIVDCFVEAVNKELNK
jgi:tripartite ATP-independent transporter DctP family solute receptor